jgi:hypothetical protein
MDDVTRVALIKELNFILWKLPLSDEDRKIVKTALMNHVSFYTRTS